MPKKYALGAYMFAQELPPVEGHLTRQFVVTDRHGAPLGVIKWFGRWHEYAFHPDMETIYNPGCMRDLAAFCERITKEHKDAKA